MWQFQQNILICASSLHSSVAVKKFYPNMVNIIPALYGFNQSIVMSEMLKNTSEVEMKSFYEKTRANIEPIRCRVNGVNCLHIMRHR